MIDVVLILEKLESLNLIRLHKITNDYYTIYCPFHSGGQERRPSFGVLLKDQVRNGRKYPAGFSHCFTCGYASSLPDMITEILKARNISKSGYDWLIENIPGFEQTSDFDYLIPGDLIQGLNETYAVEYVNSLLQKNKPSYVTEEELQKYRFTVPYMYERGLTDEIIDRYDIGVDMNYIPKSRKRPTPSITFPVKDINGNVLFVARRSIEGKFFFLPEGYDKPLYGIYELPKGCKSVDIVESVFNLTTSVKYGRPTICLLGTGTVEQCSELRKLGVQEFRLNLDPDEAGRKGTKRLKRALHDVAIVWEYSGIPEDKDVNNLTKEEFDSLELI